MGLTDSVVNTQRATDRHSGCWGLPSAGKTLPILAEAVLATLRAGWGRAAKYLGREAFFPNDVFI